MVIDQFIATLKYKGFVSEAGKLEIVSFDSNNVKLPVEDLQKVVKVASMVGSKAKGVVVEIVNTGDSITFDFTDSRNLLANLDIFFIGFPEKKSEPEEEDEKEEIEGQAHLFDDCKEGQEVDAEFFPVSEEEPELKKLPFDGEPESADEIVDQSPLG